MSTPAKKPAGPSSGVKKATAGMAKLSTEPKKIANPAPGKAVNKDNTAPANATKSGASVGAKKATGVVDKVKKKKAPAKKVEQIVGQRRRLSIAAADDTGEQTKKLDGGGLEGKDHASDATTGGGADMCFHDFKTLSKVGYVPFNTGKVNQDRFAAIEKFDGDPKKAFFGVFDGHGSVGHDVSTFVAANLPQFFLKSKYWGEDDKKMMDDAFVKCNATLAKSHVDCTFSGTTVIVVYINGKTMYSGNAGDSRAVLAKKKGNTFTAQPLSDDHKPERPDEKKRIIESKGRVEACKGMQGEDIGPSRVWLLHQDVPGLAMTRSFGDLIAASVGVIPKPEIWERQIEDDDAFMILASDGVWEFIDNQEAVNIVAGKKPEDACAALVAESTKRWNAEEEVVDDTTCIIVYFDGYYK